MAVESFIHPSTVDDGFSVDCFEDEQIRKLMHSEVIGHGDPRPTHLKVWVKIEKRGCKKQFQCTKLMMESQRFKVFKQQYLLNDDDHAAILIAYGVVTSVGVNQR